MADKQILFSAPMVRAIIERVREWSEAKRHEANVIVNVTRVIPDLSEVNLGLLGKVPDLTGTALLLSLAVQKKVMGGIAE